MLCVKCQGELPPGARFCPHCGASVPAGAGLRVNQDAGSVEGELTGVVAGSAARAAGLDVDIGQKVEKVEAGGTVTGAVLGTEGSHVHVGGTEDHRAERRIDTGGGAYIEGGVTAGGDFVGRDKITYGGGARPDAIARAFAELYKALEKMPDGPDKAVAGSAVKALESEARKADQADEGAVRRWLGFLAQTAPDAWQVAVDTFIHPILGLSTVFRKIAQRAYDTDPRE